MYVKPYIGIFKRRCQVVNVESCRTAEFILYRLYFPTSYRQYSQKRFFFWAAMKSCMSSMICCGLILICLMLLIIIGCTNQPYTDINYITLCTLNILNADLYLVYFHWRILISCQCERFHHHRTESSTKRLSNCSVKLSFKRRTKHYEYN